MNIHEHRANAKLVQAGGRRFIIGGMTADKITKDIYQIRAIEDEKGTKCLEWKLLQFKNNIFTERNSFGACGTPAGKIYIWGGLESNVNEQKCLSQLIEVDVQKGEMRDLLLKQKISIHSEVIVYDKDSHQLLAIGGTDENSQMKSYFYSLKLNDQQQQYQWTKTSLDCDAHKGYLWQHSAHLLTKSAFSGTSGRFLIVIGGCRHPQTPYSSIIEFDIDSKKVANQIKIKFGLVSHDSIVSNEEIVIFGGATGMDFNSNKIVLSKGEVKYEKAHNAVGCMLFKENGVYYVIGGVSGPGSLNGLITYKE